MTLREYVELGRLKVGHLLILHNLKDGNFNCSYRIFIGDATPYIMPTDNDGGIGWDLSDPQMKDQIVEIYEYGT